MKIKLFSGVVSLLLFAGSVLCVSCSKDSGSNNNNNGRTYTVSGSGNGAQMVPLVSTTATSNLTGTYNSSTNVLQYNITWTSLAATANGVHFYGPAAAGANATGSSQFDLGITTPGITGTAAGSITLSAQQETDLLNGKWYYTISNATHATGEVRGQVVTTVQ